MIDWANPLAPEVRRTPVQRLDGCGQCGSYTPCACDDERAGVASSPLIPRPGYEGEAAEMALKAGRWPFRQPDPDPGRPVIVKGRPPAPRRSADEHVCPCGLCPGARGRGGQRLGTCEFCGLARYALRCGHEDLGGGRLLARSVPELEQPPHWLLELENPCPPGCAVCARLAAAGM